MQTFEHGGSLRADKRNDREEGEGGPRVLAK